MKRNKTLRVSLILMTASLVLVLLQVSCRHDGFNVAELDKVCYEKEIAPIFLNSCGTTGCHDSKNGEAGYSFTNDAGVMKSVTPSDAQKSKAYKAITGKGFTQLMPPSGALTEKERILIRVWIDQGAVQTTCN